jgi:hypothetical protein
VGTSRALLSDRSFLVMLMHKAAERASNLCVMSLI